MIPKLLGTLVLATLVFAWACSSTPNVSSEDGARAQIALGGEVYGNYCADCHGDAGQGGRNTPPVVGDAAFPLDPPEGSRFRKGQFRTALDIAMFATTTMPPDEESRAEMTEEMYWAVLAFALDANGVALDAPLDGDRAGAIVLHP
ncbi:MAG: cytochrome c [bacterium]|nr:cytochrome c [bacterium]